MATANGIMGSSLLMEISSFIPSTRLLFNQKQSKLCFSPGLVRLDKKRVSARKVVTSPVAAISENLVRIVPEKPVKFKVRASVTVRKKIKEHFKEAIVNHLDALTDKIGRNIVFELISTEIDPRTKAPKRSNEAVLRDWSKKSKTRAERVTFTAEFMVDSNFGVPGAITVSNKHQNEFFLESIVVEDFACGPVYFACNSWVQANKDHPGKRVFFSDMPYLPWETPAGLKDLREKELKEPRGDGKGYRKKSDRIYDYATYNDLGNPDKNDLARLNLGGEAIPYPRLL